MLLGRAAQAWSALYDNLYLSTNLEQKIRMLVGTTEIPVLPKELSPDTKALVASTLVEVSDYCRDRRDYLESVTTLDLIVTVERTLRKNLEARQNGFKSRVSRVAASLLDIPNTPGQKFPAARKLLKQWRSAAGVDSDEFDAIDEGMQYRNWLVHDGIGVAPFILNPFLLDTPVQHIIFIIHSEP